MEEKGYNKIVSVTAEGTFNALIKIERSIGSGHMRNGRDDIKSIVPNSSDQASATPGGFLEHFAGAFPIDCIFLQKKKSALPPVKTSNKNNRRENKINEDREREREREAHFLKCVRLSG
jgi:hypothetical protein